MNRTFRITFVTLIALLAALSGTALAQGDASAACPLGGMPNEETGGCDVAVTMNIAYPSWIGESEAAVTAVGDLLTAARDEFLGIVEFMFAPYSPAASLDISYIEFEHGAPLRSIVFTVNTYTGGAHPNYYYLSVTVDTLADRVLTLEDDIFQPGADVIAVLQPLVAAELAAQQGEYADIEWINGGTDELSDYVAWAINAGTLELFFPPYHVAPYAMGGFEVSIPVDDLASVINPMLLP